MDASRLRPMLASAATLQAVSHGPWAYEFKWDGVRALVQHRDGGRMGAWSRNGNDFTASFPELDRLLDHLPEGAVLDGEIVAFDDGGRPSFQVLQRRLHLRNEARVAQARARTPVAFVVFDVLHDGTSKLLDAPYTVRRETLEGLGLPAPTCQVPAALDDLTTALKVVGDLGLEGVVAKRPASTYRPGERSDHWRKLRIKVEQEFVVGGYRPGKGGRATALGSLLLGVHDDLGNLVFSGSVGSGINDRELATLRAHLDEHARADSPFATPVPHDDAVFADPVLVVQVRFTEWTEEGHLRQPVYRGRRNDKDPADVRRES